MTTKHFQMPPVDASDEEQRKALDTLNTIKLTLGQFEVGWEIFQCAQKAAFECQAPSEVPMAALRAFCRSEQIAPDDVGAVALHTRGQRMTLAAWEAAEGGGTITEEEMLRFALMPLELEYECEE